MQGYRSASYIPTHMQPACAYSFLQEGLILSTVADGTRIVEHHCRLDSPRVLSAHGSQSRGTSQSEHSLVPVSYTHLTLPTKRIV